MHIKEYEELGVTVFSIEGRVDSDGVAILKETLRHAVKDGKYNMILDMSDVNYINSAGLRILAEVVTETTENGGDLRLVGLTPKVRRIFEIIGFIKFFRIYDSVLEAMDGF